MKLRDMDENELEELIQDVLLSPSFLERFLIVLLNAAVRIKIVAEPSQEEDDVW